MGTSIYIYIYIYICLYTHMFVCVYIYIYMCVCVDLRCSLQVGGASVWRGAGAYGLRDAAGRCDPWDDGPRQRSAPLSGPDPAGVLRRGGGGGAEGGRHHPVETALTSLLGGGGAEGGRHHPLGDGSDFTFVSTFGRRIDSSEVDAYCLK